MRTEIVKNRQEVTQKMQDREKKKKQIIAERAEELNRELAEKAAQAKAEMEAQENQNVNVYEDAFRKIKDATGVADVNEVIQKIVNQEDTQTNLMDLQRDNQTKIETLKEEKDKLKAKVDELKYSGTGNVHKRKMVDDSEENLSVATVKLERIKDKYEKAAKKLLGVKAGVKHLTEKVESVRDDDDQHILITDDTVVEAFYQVESLLMRLLKDINRSKATSPTPKEELEVAKNLTIMGISDQEIMETRPYNALITSCRFLRYYRHGRWSRRRRFRWRQG